ncbi:hypothetical protein CNYM01_13806 [Colletotrichum nymphaeae SA-01]|uniref:Uncharacterized protein n=1 Tax=Colletotrichum nymphaeae SA-01 TaxID=1460502 RepID=A0A135UU98_9PEZI|nr:hypothetical protein CNYM01_13806 [Colletotrichum nymphaeae SA-01]
MADISRAVVVETPKSRLDYLVTLESLCSQRGVGLLAVLVLANERVRVLLLVEVAEGMVYASVNGLCRIIVSTALLLSKGNFHCGKGRIRTISPDVQNQILHRPLALGNLPILHRDIGDHEIRIGPLRQQALVDLVETARVRVHGLLLEVPDEAVGDLGGDEVRQEHAVEEDALGAEDHDLHEPARLRHLHERQEVHALVEALLEERLDPAVVALHAAQAAEVAEHAGDHARDCFTNIQVSLAIPKFAEKKKKKKKKKKKNSPPAILSKKMNRTSHCASVSGLSATNDVVGFFLSTCCSEPNPVARSMNHRASRTNFHAAQSPTVRGARWSGTMSCICCSV